MAPRASLSHPASRHTPHIPSTQVALQLCENALRFTKEGEICIEMTVAPDADGGGSSKGGDEPESYRLVLAVIDSGVGIKAEQQSTLFSSFARNKAS